jgi:hypothetical protein
MQGQPNQSMQAVVNEGEIPTRRELARSFWEKEKPAAVVVYPSGKLENEFKEIVKKMVESSKEYLTLTTKCADEFDQKDAENQAIIALGCPQNNKVVAASLAGSPFEIETKKLKIGDSIFEGENTVGLLPFYPNPMNQGQPLFMMTGCNDQAILSLLNKKISEDWQVFRWGGWGYEVYEDNRRVLLGFLNNETWELVEKERFEFKKQPEVLAENTHFKFISGFSINSSLVEELKRLSETNIKKIQAFTNTQKQLPKFNYYLYPNTEEKGLILQNTEHSNVNFQGSEVHTVLNDTYRDNFIGKENELVLRQLLGQPKTIALERGLSIYFTQKWQKKGWKYWAARLAESDSLIPLSELLNEDILNNGSRLLTGCLVASFADFLIETFGKETLLERYISWSPDESEIKNLERQWHTYLSNYEPPKKTKLMETSIKDLPYLKGFNFAHEGYRIYNGYGSRKATESLEKLTDLGTNAIAIVPYGYMRNPNSPTFLGIANRAGSETDESVIHANAMAKKMGMEVLLKPQLWLRWDSWPGDVEMNSEEDWQAFFHHYHHWIIHYAMLAEIYEMPMFCLGVEFAKATVQRGKDWRKLIRKARGIYSGKLTYAANWGEEFEKVDFWDELDFIGLNCYYPLSKNDEVSKDELKNNYEKVIDKIEYVCKKYDKPLVFTEIGFRSINTPWKEPHAGARNDKYNGQHQKMCYEVIFESIKDKEWCQGILWWKFPCYLDYRGVENGSFTPNNKPAESVVKEWFLKMEDFGRN